MALTCGNCASRRRSDSIDLYHVHDETVREELGNLARDGRSEAWHNAYLAPCPLRADQMVTDGVSGALAITNNHALPWTTAAQGAAGRSRS